MWREQREGLARLIAAMLEHFRYEPLTDSEMSQTVRLFKEELRRGRHPVSLRELLNAQPETQYEFVFSVLRRKKIRLRPTASATWPLDVRLSNRAERFRNRDKSGPGGGSPPRTEINSSPPPPPALAVDPVELSCPTMSQQPNIPARVADWLRREVPPDLWAELREASIFRLTRVPGLRSARTGASTVEDLMVSTRPKIADEDRNFALAELNFFADWLLAWMLALISDRPRAVTTISAGFALAVR